MSGRSKRCGFTLIELLIALVILSLLGLMSWRALSAALDSREQILAVEQRWQRLSRSLNLIETHLIQAAVREGRSTEAEADFRLIKLGSGEQRLVFLRTDAARGARLAGFAQEADRLLLLRWPSNLTLDEPRSELILDGVSQLRWSVMTAERTWTDNWADSSLPLGVKLEMEVRDAGRIERVFALH